ncbi:MAG: TonB-dependent receptor [Flavobacteriales bacterium]|nr:TonB-dependent receptor [Flavobacteriales bacterium]
MKNKIVLLILFFGIFRFGISQQISGKILEETPDGLISLPGANIYWLHETGGTTSDENGDFKLKPPKAYPTTLIVSYVGYKTDSIKLETPKNNLKIKLSRDVELDVFEISEREKSSSVSLVAPIHVETLSEKELTKAACCNISESFETNASVDVNLSDAVSGTKKIQMLGLDGAYTQIQLENIPFVRGIASPFGLTFIPGTWAKEIQIKKGAGSVVNGYESITGQINVELQKPDETDRLFVNGYFDDGSRAELNIHAGQKMNDKWSTMQFAHLSNQSYMFDKNNDSFLDLPLKQQYNFFNRWKYKGEKHIAQYGFRGVYDKIEAGQIKSTEIINPYQIQVLSQQAEIFTKNGFLFPKEPYKSIGIITNARFHQHDSKYGLKKFDAIQKSIYVNTIYQSIIGNTDNVIRFGGSLVYDEFKNNYNDSLNRREEVVPGIFTEYSYTDSIHSLVLGLRIDQHNLYGKFATPRFHYKYKLAEHTAARLSFGRGQRTANPLIENAAVMSSSRIVEVDQNLKPEVAWNYGTSVTHHMELFHKETNIDVDYFFTNFENQVVVDIENTRKISFYNLKGKSFSHSFQAEIAMQLSTQFEIKAAYKWYDIQISYQDGLKQKPMIPSHRVLVNMAYYTNFDKWKFDFTTQWFSTSRIPSTLVNLPENRVNERTIAFATINTQVTRAFKRFDIYFGVENATDFKQSSPIISAHQPFSSEFDASMIWGSVFGRMFYTGFRFKIK